MKKVFTSVSILLIVLSASAQNIIPISFGLKGGYIYSDINTVKSVSKNATIVNDDASSGGLFGVYARVNFKKWYFQPELNYVIQKSKFSIDQQPTSGALNEYEVKRYTLDVPLQIGYKLLSLPVVKLRIFGGPVASFKMDDKLKLKNVKTQVSNTISDDFKTANWAIRGGIGADVWKLNLDIAYQKGLNDVSDKHFKKADFVLITLGYKLF